MNMSLMLLTGGVAASNGENGGGLLINWIIAVAVVVSIFYYTKVRPMEKEKKRLQEMYKTMEVGDVVLTTGDFYGVLIDVTDEDVIVEFGSNKNCRVPMKKTAIAQVYKADKDGDENA